MFLERLFDERSYGHLCFVLKHRSHPAPMAYTAGRSTQCEMLFNDFEMFVYDFEKLFNDFEMFF